MHELGNNECPKSFVFQGTKEYSAKQVGEMLGLGTLAVSNAQQQQQQQAPNQMRRPPQPPAAAARFLLPNEQCEFALTNIIEQLQKDPWPVDNDKRAMRSTGAALSVAIGLLEATFPNTGARVMLFAGGPATVGPGQVTGVELREPIRSHSDMEKDTAKYHKRSCKVHSP